MCKRHIFLKFIYLFGIVVGQKPPFINGKWQLLKRQKAYLWHFGCSKHSQKYLIKKIKSKNPFENNLNKSILQSITFFNKMSN
jgi:hypothetical protein